MVMMRATERRLAAIFAADVEGYSGPMGADEVGTLRDLTQRRVILDRLIEARRGRIADTAADSVLAPAPTRRLNRGEPGCRELLSLIFSFKRTCAEQICRTR